MENLTIRHLLLWSIVIVIAMLTSCRSMKEKALTYAENHPKEFAKFCGEKFPPVDSVAKPIIRYIPADNKNYTDQINKLSDMVDSLQLVNHQDKSDIGKQYQGTIDVLAKEVKKLRGNYKPCVPDTMYYDINHYITNTGKVAYLSEEVDKLKKELQKSKDGNTKKTYWIIGLGFLSVSALLLLLRRK